MTLRKVGHKAEVVISSPEGQPQPTAGHQHPVSFAQGNLAPRPDAVETRCHVEAAVAALQRRSR
jgi:hypothetical protein